MEKSVAISSTSRGPGRPQKGHHHHGGRGRGRGPLPPPPEAATASELSDVDRSIVMAGGVTAANLPQEARNLRRSSLTSGGWCPFSSGVIFSPPLIPI